MTQAASAFMEMEFPAEVWLACERVSLGRLLDLQAGDVLALAKDPEADVDLVVNGVTVASGQLVVIDGSFGIKVTRTATRKLADLDSNAGEENSQ